MKKPFFLLFAATLLFSCGLSIVNPSEVLSEEIDSSNTTSEKEEVTSITTSSEIITSIEYSSVEENTSIPETSEVTCEIDTYWNPTYFVAEKGYIYCDFNCAVDWDMVYMYAWNAVGTGLDTSCTIWPGAQMTKDEITGYFKCYIGDDIMAANIILSNGEENKTETLAYYSHAPLLVFIDNSLNYKWLNINHEEPFSEWLISINMIDFIELEDWSNGTSHPELPTGSEDLTISSSGTPIGSYSLNTGKFYHNIDTTTGEPIATWRIYQNESPKLTISSSTKSILTIEISFINYRDGTLLYNDEVVQSKQILEIGASSAELSVGNASSDGKSGQIRITAIKVLLF